jgi:hypothetical protein
MSVCWSKANASGVRGLAPAVAFVTTKTGTTKTA